MKLFRDTIVGGGPESFSLFLSLSSWFHFVSSVCFSLNLELSLSPLLSSSLALFPLPLSFLPMNYDNAIIIENFGSSPNTCMCNPICDALFSSKIAYQKTLITNLTKILWK